MKKKWIAAVIIYAALVAACLIVVYAVPSVKGMLETTYVTEYGKIDITDEVSAYIVRDETVYVAAQDSEVKRLAETDKLINAKTRIVELTPIIDEKAEAAKEAGPDADQDTAEAAAEANAIAPENISRKYQGIIEDLAGDVHPSEKGVSQQA
jgi:ABC-type lipoprotein release transport system permease subunit